MAENHQPPPPYGSIPHGPSPHDPSLHGPSSHGPSLHGPHVPPPPQWTQSNNVSDVNGPSFAGQTSIGDNANFGEYDVRMSTFSF
ncbi:hypothetical protein BC936DRAFT_140328 [Jimgerdemannia flammicorona]|uniref:Uncharacterized protein n=1 Tax=Jimgerdemannia flammicorona TaxID=994334 RepID=A0A433AUJ2_9FUNG|nr:hypothetical protein BC936DRAFT_140328 [Jimgerdemannia flammicorona]